MVNVNNVLIDSTGFGFSLNMTLQFDPSLSGSCVAWLIDMF
jgi:hypothetical protein